ncbi:MAG: sugar kinase [Leptolyngbyaceae cyanobacterium HOT.MB2.61]|jgi:sugar/nucleoside kinase (ribokinase family)|nr:sugar kinase [Leptolyngbyaceae cyanobacterium HOT.MB2.61]
MKRGLFVGLLTLDLIYRIEHLPARNQKIVASDYTVAAGGPATNAAVAFCHLENSATVLAAVGTHPITHLILTDLQQCGVTVVDLSPARTEPPPVSSILITEATGERAVVSINTVKTQLTADSIPVDCLQNVDIVLIDGHQMEVGRAIAQRAKAHNIPVVIDGGSWKSGFETVLSLADYAICSASFRPPGCRHKAEVMEYLSNLGIAHIAITQGEQPIHYWNHNQRGQIEVPPVKAVDTLGAGDIFHGAFCHAILQRGFMDALEAAARVAAHSCQFFGTRCWMDKNRVEV